MIVELTCNFETYLFTSGDELDHLLQSPSTMLIGSNINHGWSSIVDQNGALFLASKFKNLLAEVVSEAILHELDDMVLNLREDEG